MTTGNHRIKIRTHECDVCKKNDTTIVIRGYDGVGIIYRDGIPSCANVAYCPYCGSSLGWHEREEE